MSTIADSAENAAGSGDSWVTPTRLRNMPSRLLTHTAMHAERLVNEGLAKVDAQKWHYAVLVALHEFGPASQATLSRRTDIYRSDLVGVINKLAERSYVKRAPDSTDRRRNVITLTPQGRRRMRQLDKLLAGIQDDLLAPLSQPERDQLTGMLTRLLDYRARPTTPSTGGQSG
jgi:DNA-binding MarR family transcriptional regulator